MVLINKVKCVDKFIFCKPNKNSSEASHEELLAYDCKIHVHHRNLNQNPINTWKLLQIENL
jgi:hypothetical protein